MSKHNIFYHKGKKILFSSMAVAALSVIAANPVAAKAAESQGEQTSKPADAKPTIPANSGDNAGEDDSNMLLPSKWTKDNCSYDEKTNTLTIKAGTIDNDYKVSEDNPINPAQIAWNIDGVDTDQIQTIKIDGAVTFKGDASSLFAGLPNLEKIEGLNNLDTTDVTCMKQMFASDPKLTSLDLSNFDTSKVTNMMGMFFDDEALNTLDVSKFTTDSVEDMSYMFSNDSSLTKIDGLEKFNTGKVTKMWEMFKGDKALTSLDISSFKMLENNETIKDNVSDTNNTDDNKGTTKPSRQTYTIDQDMLSGMDSLNDIKLGAGNIINNSGLPGSVEESLHDGETKTTWFLKDSKNKGLSSVELMQKFDGKNDVKDYVGEYTTTKSTDNNNNNNTPNTPTTPSNTTNTGNTNTNTTTDKQDTNKTDTNKPDTTKPTTDNKKPAKKAKKGVKRVVTHNAYIFNQKGKRVKGEYFVGKTITTYGTKTINGKKFYALGKNRFVKANNVTGINRKLKHNAFIYTKKANNKVKRYGRDVLKKNKTVRTYGGAVKMHNKLYYIVGKNQFVKKANF